MSNDKLTLVIGASDNPARYSYLAINKLVQHGYPVVAIGNRSGVVGNISFNKEKPEMDHVHTVTLYINPGRQEEYYDYILSLKPKRIIFNPGTENEVLEKLANAQGIEVQEACTLVLLSIGAY